MTRTAHIVVPDGRADERVLAIDGGDKSSALLLLDLVTGRPLCHGHLSNEDMLREIGVQTAASTVAIEKLTGFGQRASFEEFETQLWVGRFEQRAKDSGGEALLLTRREIKQHLCGTSGCGDPEVRGALLDRFGGKAALERARKCPRKKHGPRPGVADCGCGGTARLGADGALAGVRDHVWSALAVAITYRDTRWGGRSE